MPHPLDEVRDTPWGINVAERIGILESQVRELDMGIVGVRADLRLNSEQTNSIKADTQWLVNVYKGSKALGPVIVGFSVFMAGVAAVGAWLWAIFHGGK